MITLEELRDNWAIVAGFAAGAVAWGKTAMTADSARRSATKAHERADEATKDMTAMKDSIARLETHAEYTVKGIDELRSALLRSPPS
jgi:hypothetical protein